MEDQCLSKKNIKAKAAVGVFFAIKIVVYFKTVCSPWVTTVILGLIALLSSSRFIMKI